MIVHMGFPDREVADMPRGGPDACRLDRQVAVARVI